MKSVFFISALFGVLSVYSQTFEFIYRTELDDWVGNAVFINDEEVAFVVSSGDYFTAQYPSKLFKFNINIGMLTDSAVIDFYFPNYVFAGASVVAVLDDGTLIIRGFPRPSGSNERHVYFAHYDQDLIKIFDTLITDITRRINDIKILGDSLMVLCGTVGISPPLIDYIEERDINGVLVRGRKSIFNGRLSTFYRTETHYHVFGDIFRPYAIINIQDLQVDTILSYTHSLLGAQTTVSAYNDYYFIGAQRVRSPNKDNLVLLKMSNSGEVLAEFEYFTSRYSYFASNGIDLHDEFVFLGGSEFFTSGPGTFIPEPRAIQLIKLNHSGEVIWQKIYNYLDVNYRLEKVLATPDGGALLFATRYDWLDPIPFQRDVYILKVDSDGNTVVGTENITHSRPGVKVYPNPASTVINIAVEKKAALSISVFNAIGSVVYTGEFTSSASIDVSGFRPGMYYYTISGQIGVHYSGRFIKIE